MRNYKCGCPMADHYYERAREQGIPVDDLLTGTCPKCSGVNERMFSGDWREAKRSLSPTPGTPPTKE